MSDSPPDLNLIARLLRQVLAAAKACGVKLGGRSPNQRKLHASLGTATLVRASDEFAARVAPIAIEFRNVLLRHERISIGHAQLLTIKQTPGPPGREVAADHAGD
jgi:hypothetical protein